MNLVVSSSRFLEVTLIKQSTLNKQEATHKNKIVIV